MATLQANSFTSVVVAASQRRQISRDIGYCFYVLVYSFQLIVIALLLMYCLILTMLIRWQITMGQKLFIVFSFVIWKVLGMLSMNRTKMKGTQLMDTLQAALFFKMYVSSN